MTYDDAVAELYRAASDQFVAERKRLAAELKAGGDKPGAAAFGKLARPTLSAWAVNQLWWHAREGFEQLFASAARLRAGELEAARAHRELIARLRKRAAALLEEAGHAASDAVLRRVSATLSALAAQGGFDPDPPGALATDREPPGFDVAGLAAAFPAPSSSPGARGPADRAVQEPDSAAPRQQLEQQRARNEAAERAHEQERQRLKAAEERLRVETEQRRRDAERANSAEREKLDDAVRAARIQIETRKLELERARIALATAEQKLEQARIALAEFLARPTRHEPG